MSEEKPFAFVLMPFDAAFDDIYKFGIKEPAERLGIMAQRVDEQLYKEGMLDRIYNQISVADIIIADMTGRNPNVFYEVGYAHAKDKICVLLTSVSDDIPFDLKHRRHVVYGGSIKKLQTEIESELTWAKQESENIKDTKIHASLRKIDGSLERTKFVARAILGFSIDLNNHSDQPSSEIEMAYFYTGRGWGLQQDGKDCPSSESDVPGFHLRHFIECPVRRLRPKGWAQIRFRAKKHLAFAFNGEELKDSYPINGRSLLRLVTSDGDADYELPVDVVADEMPF